MRKDGMACVAVAATATGGPHCSTQVVGAAVMGACGHEKQQEQKLVSIVVRQRCGRSPPRARVQRRPELECRMLTEENEKPDNWHQVIEPNERGAESRRPCPHGTADLGREEKRQCVQEEVEAEIQWRRNAGFASCC